MFSPTMHYQNNIIAQRFGLGAGTCYFGMHERFSRLKE